MREAASFIASQTSSAPLGALQDIRRFLTDTLHHWNDRREVAALTDVDDHILVDLGLTREDVTRALQLPFGHDPGRELQRIRNTEYRGWRA